MRDGSAKLICTQASAAGLDTVELRRRGIHFRVAPGRPRAAGRGKAAPSGATCRADRAWLAQISYADLQCACAWGLSSAGRAVALQASGHRFDPDRLHHAPSGTNLAMKTRDPRAQPAVRTVTVHFDIVNGFLKSMPWRYRASSSFCWGSSDITTKQEGT